MNQIKIGKFISEKRKEQKFTQEQLAEKLNVSKNAVSKWERGLNLPDASIMKDLCAILKITLNDFFAGETLKEQEIIEQSEKTIINIIKNGNNKIKKYKIIITTILIIIVILSLKIILIKKGYMINDESKYSQIYISGESNSKGDVEINKFGKIHIDFDIGANKYGNAVFKQPEKALKRLKKDYSNGLKLIQKEFNLLPLNNFNFRLYGTYGWQVTTGTKEEQEQARFISSFIDIYENSFN